MYQVGDMKLFFVLPYKEYRKHDKDKYSLNHLAFGVRSVKELKDFENKLNKGAIKNSGIQISKYSGRGYIWFDDPDGYRIEFYLRS